MNNLGVAAFVLKYRTAKVPIEVHLFSHGGHAFNMGTRSQLATLRGWPQRMADWMADNHLLDRSQSPDKTRRE